MAVIGVSVILALVVVGFAICEVVKTVYRCQRENAAAQMDDYEKQVLFNAQQQKTVAGRMTEYGNSMRNPLPFRSRIVRPRADEDSFSIEDDTPNIGGVNTNGEPV